MLTSARVHSGTWTLAIVRLPTVGLRGRFPRPGALELPCAFELGHPRFEGPEASLEGGALGRREVRGIG